MDQIDLESGDFEFKAINRGLGFHNEIKDISRNPKKNKAPPTFKNINSPPIVKMPEVSLSEIRKTLEPKNQKKTEDSSIVTVIHRMKAYVLDNVIILSGLLLTLTILARLTGLSYERGLLPDLMIFSGGMYSFYYILYFSILEIMPSSSLGKMFFQLEVQTDSGTRITFSESLIRSLFSLIAFPFIWLEPHGTVSKTMVVRSH
jgi:hypothetical protein